jgi:hypothetical protein
MKLQNDFVLDRLELARNWRGCLEEDFASAVRAADELDVLELFSALHALVHFCHTGFAPNYLQLQFPQRSDCQHPDYGVCEQKPVREYGNGSQRSPEGRVHQQIPVGDECCADLELEICVCRPECQKQCGKINRIGWNHYTATCSFQRFCPVDWTDYISCNNNIKSLSFKSDSLPPLGPRRKAKVCTFFKKRKIRGICAKPSPFRLPIA